MWCRLSRRKCSKTSRKKHRSEIELQGNRKSSVLPERQSQTLLVESIGVLCHQTCDEQPILFCTRLLDDKSCSSVRREAREEQGASLAKGRNIWLIQVDSGLGCCGCRIS
jgi:hypothetical protein